MLLALMKDMQRKSARRRRHGEPRRNRVPNPLSAPSQGEGPLQLAGSCAIVARRFVGKQVWQGAQNLGNHAMPRLKVKPIWMRRNLAKAQSIWKRATPEYGAPMENMNRHSCSHNRTGDYLRGAISPGQWRVFVDICLAKKTQ